MCHCDPRCSRVSQVAYELAVKGCTWYMMAGDAVLQVDCTSFWQVGMSTKCLHQTSTTTGAGALTIATGETFWRRRDSDYSYELYRRLCGSGPAIMDICEGVVQMLVTHRQDNNELDSHPPSPREKVPQQGLRLRTPRHIDNE